VFWTDYQANVHVLDPFSKKVLWIKERIRFCYPTIDDNILIGRYDNEEDPNTIVFEKIDPLTGSIIWSKTDKSIVENINVHSINFQDIVPQMMGQYILVSDFNGNLFLIDTEDGNLMWAYSSNNGGDYINIRVHENKFFAEQRGANSIYCFSIAK